MHSAHSASDAGGKTTEGRSHLVERSLVAMVLALHRCTGFKQRLNHVEGDVGCVRCHHERGEPKFVRFLFEGAQF